MSGNHPSSSKIFNTHILQGFYKEHVVGFTMSSSIEISNCILNHTVTFSKPENWCNRTKYPIRYKALDEYLLINAFVLSLTQIWPWMVVLKCLEDFIKWCFKSCFNMFLSNEILAEILDDTHVCGFALLLPLNGLKSFSAIISFERKIYLLFSSRKELRKWQFVAKKLYKLSSNVIYVYVYRTNRNH